MGTRFHPGPQAARTATRHLGAREAYKLWAATYDVDANPLLALGERSLEPLLPSVRGRTVLDLGCGTGRWLRKAVDQDPRLALGADFTSEMVGKAAAGAELRNRLILADCLWLPLRPRLLDLVVCSFILSHVFDLRCVARELRRVVRPPADLFIADMHPVAQARGWRCGFRHETGRVEVDTFIHTKRDVQELFGSEGFSLTRSLDLHFGEPERAVFAHAGHADSFEAACAMPAVVVYHFSLN